MSRWKGGVEGGGWLSLVISYREIVIFIWFVYVLHNNNNNNNKTDKLNSASS